MPVEQTGEDVLFVQEGDQLETHVLIRYDGEAENFAWVVPVMSMPEIDVGSEPLFARLSAATAPRSDITDTCADPDPGGCSFANCGDTPPVNNLPDVVDEFMVGTFEGVVLDGGTVEGVMTWLDDNGYAAEAAAEPIIGEYLEAGFLFVAFRLKGGADVDEIHPIIIRQETDEPCVPIRLTSIAAEDDMGVRVYFLDDTRWVPTNYKHVELNRLRVKWPERTGTFGGFSGAYNEVLSMAVDEAGGRAFVTQYAGPNDVSTAGVVDPQWNGDAYVGLSPREAIELLVSHNLMACNDWAGCVGMHSLVAPALREFLPAPEQTSEPLYWYGVSLGSQPAAGPWSGADLGQRLEERVFEPGRHAADLLESYPYLTRMGTTISAHEMTKDPVFARNYDLGDVDPTLIGTMSAVDGDPYCDDFRVYQLDGATFCTDGEWPELGPYAARIEQYLAGGGPPLVSYDAAADIEAAVAMHNEMACSEIDMPDPPDGSEDTGGQDDAGGEESAGDESGGAGDGERASCTCNAGSRGGGPLWAVVALFGIAAVRRRKM